MRPIRVVIAGGGTGGHLFPGIAVARELLRRSPDARVTFAGTARGIEARVVPREGFELDLLRSAGLKGTTPAALVRGVALLPLSGMDAWRIVSRRAPDVVVGVGGYSSGPVVMTAALRGIPTVLLEQNAVPGLTNRSLARFVTAAAVTFESTAAYFGRRAIVTGNPVRSEFFTPDELLPSAVRRPRVLIVGGSQGAHAINVAMVEAAPKLAAFPGGLAVTHQTGERDVELVRNAYLRAGLDAVVEPFLFTMDREVKGADLIVCRAGATTLAELTAAGRPALLVPLPTAADDHQRKNAEVLVAAGAADVMDQASMTGQSLGDRITSLLGDRPRLTAMAEAARRQARPDAAARIADTVLELAETRAK
jgi:UDP-N-acetylglucosamine--N-acetylmuramyl-(pentapeptide) pyrophosphoryl-undecaprenol N-acetylglucosamine transferase